MTTDLTYLTTHPFVRLTALDKAHGILLGSALGDAIGLYTEFLPRQECLKAYPTAKFELGVTRFREDSHRDKFDPGSWTDDTDHALLLVLSYLHNRWSLPADIDKFARDFAGRLSTWCVQGLRCLETPPLGLGQTVGRIARDAGFIENAREVAMGVWLRASEKVKPAPNGSLMRTHPLGVMCVGLGVEETFEIAAKMSEVTHVDVRCVFSCVAVTGVLRGMLRGEITTEAELDALLVKVEQWVLGRPIDTRMVGSAADLLHVTELHEKYLAVGSYEQMELDDRGTLGYVYKALGSSLLALRKAMREPLSSFEALVSELVMQGGDADTNACTAAALLGCWFGASRLPDQWRDGLQHGEWFRWKARDLTTIVGIGLGEVPTGDQDTELDGGKGLLEQTQLNKMESDMVFKVLEKSRIRNQERLEQEKGKKKWFAFG